jgi:hypothetical protein
MSGVSPRRPIIGPIDERPRLNPRFKDILVACHCSKYAQLYVVYPDNTNEILSNVDYADPECEDASWSRIPNNSKTQVWLEHCSILYAITSDTDLSYSFSPDTDFLRELLNESYRVLKVGGRVIFKIKNSDKNSDDNKFKHIAQYSDLYTLQIISSKNQPVLLQKYDSEWYKGNPLDHNLVKKLIVYTKKNNYYIDNLYAANGRKI